MGENFLFFWGPLPQDWLEVLVKGGENKSFSRDSLFVSVFVLKFGVWSLTVGCLVRLCIQKESLLQLNLVVITGVEIPGGRGCPSTPLVGWEIGLSVFRM